MPTGAENSLNLLAKTGGWGSSKKTKQSVEATKQNQALASAAGNEASKVAGYTADDVGSAVWGEVKSQVKAVAKPWNASCLTTYANKSDYFKCENCCNGVKIPKKYKSTCHKLCVDWNKEFKEDADKSGSNGKVLTEVLFNPTLDDMYDDS